MKKFSLIFLLGLTACTGIKQDLGLTRRMPDEFSVVKRAPLEIPANLDSVTALNAPQPGMQRPQEQSPEQAAQQAVLGTAMPASNAASAAETALLQNAGAGKTDPDIRSSLNRETAEIERRNKPVIRRIFNMESQSAAEVLDADAEAKRLNRPLPGK